MSPSASLAVDGAGEGVRVRDEAADGGLVARRLALGERLDAADELGRRGGLAGPDEGEAHAVGQVDRAHVDVAVLAREADGAAEDAAGDVDAGAARALRLGVRGVGDGEHARAARACARPRASDRPTTAAVTAADEPSPSFSPPS